MYMCLSISITVIVLLHHTLPNNTEIVEPLPHLNHVISQALPMVVRNLQG